MEYRITRKVLAFFVAPLAAIAVSGLFCFFQPLGGRGQFRNLSHWAGESLACSVFALPVAYVATLIGGGAALAWSHKRASPITRRLAVCWGLVGGLLAGTLSAYALFSPSWPPGTPSSNLFVVLVPFLGIGVPSGGASGLLFQCLLGAPEAG
jgi:hypothetical protein